MQRHLPRFGNLAGGLALVLAAAGATAAAPDYAILVSTGTQAEAAWRPVVAALRDKYAPDTAVHAFKSSPDEALPALRAERPRWVCWVARPEEIDVAAVARMHRLARRLDDDPWGDCLWGIVTASDAAGALRIAQDREPLLIRRGAGTTGFDTSGMTDALIISDGRKGAVSLKTGDRAAKDSDHDPQDPAGLGFLFRDFWDEHQPQVLVTSGHATQYNLEMSWGQGLVVCTEGRFRVLRRDQLPGFARFLSGAMFAGDEADLVRYVRTCRAPEMPPPREPRVWIGAGNCLLGDVRRSPNTMTPTALGAGGFRQLVGYTVPTWYGKMGWGVLGRFFGSGGQLTLAESFFLTNQEILDETARRNPKLLKVDFDAPDIEHALRDPSFASALKDATGGTPDKDAIGLVHDRDVVAFYGDPRWSARLDPARAHPSLKLALRAVPGGFDVRAEAAEGFKGGGFGVFFPARVPGAAAACDAKLDALCTDDFLLVRSLDLPPGQTAVIRIRG